MYRAAKAVWFLGFVGFVLPISACGGKSDDERFQAVCENAYDSGDWPTENLDRTEYVEDCVRDCQADDWRDFCLNMESLLKMGKLVP